MQRQVRSFKAFPRDMLGLAYDKLTYVTFGATVLDSVIGVADDGMWHTAYPGRNGYEITVGDRISNMWYEGDMK